MESEEFTTLLIRANLCLIACETQMALECFEKAIQIRPNDPNLYTFRGMCHFDLDNFDKATSDLENAVKLNPNDKLAIKYKQLVYERLQELKGN